LNQIIPIHFKLLLLILTQSFIKWLEPFQELIGEKIGFFYSIVQMKIIFKKLGMPSSFYSEEAA
jgi:hypothetical protein